MRLTALSFVPFLGATLVLACKDDAPSTETAASAKATAKAATVVATASTATITTGAMPAARPAAETTELKRFPDEKALDIADHVNMDINVRTAPHTHDSQVMLAIRAGTAVKKIAQRKGWFLVTFADPKDKSRTLTGWVWDKAFAPLSGPGDEKKLCACYIAEYHETSCDAVAGAAMGECDRTYKDDCKKLLACVHGEIAPECNDKERLITPQNVCARLCKANADCPTDTICTSQLGTPNVCTRAQPL